MPDNTRTAIEASVRERVHSPAAYARRNLIDSLTGPQYTLRLVAVSDPEMFDTCTRWLTQDETTS